MNTQKHTSPLFLMKQLWDRMIQASGDQAPKLKMSVYLGIVTAVLRGGAFLSFMPLFLFLMDKKWAQVLIVLGCMSVILVISSITDWYSRDYDYKGASTKAGDQLRRALGVHLKQVPLEVLYSKRSGDLTALAAEDVNDIVNYSAMMLLLLINAVLIPCVVGIGACFIDWRIGLSLLLVFPLALPIYFWIKPKLTKDRQCQMEAHMQLSAETLEYLQGLPALKSAGCVGEKATRFQEAAKRVETVQKKAISEQAPANALLGSVVEIGILCVVGLGLYLSTQGDVQLMCVAALMVCVVRFAEPLSTFLGMMSVLELVSVIYQRLAAFMEIEPLSQTSPEKTPTRFDIEFKEVSFLYAEQTQPALKNVNLSLKERSLTALVGASGSGKSTLIKALMRYADVSAGEIKIGGVNLKQIPPQALSQMISVVFQDVYLFDDTILANIRMGCEQASDEAVYAAARAACCHDFIQQLPNGYQTKVGEIGGNLSGGERQRISIARAFLKNAPIIILDEPTAALDTHSEVAVQNAIDALVKDRTVIVIAHRLSTISGASQIVVLNEGEIVEVGTHDGLLERQGRYERLWNIQCCGIV